MSTDLYRVSKTCWAVKSSKIEEVAAFNTIEQAADFLESIGIPGDEVDMAIMDMTGKANNHANFGALRGEFIFSDVQELDEKIGVA